MAVLFATGNTHGDFRRFGKNVFFEQANLTKDDCVIVCGDFGIWDNNARETHRLYWPSAAATGFSVIVMRRL